MKFIITNTESNESWRQLDSGYVKTIEDMGIKIYTESLKKFFYDKRPDLYTATIVEIDSLEDLKKIIDSFGCTIKMHGPYYPGYYDISIDDEYY